MKEKKPEMKKTIEITEQNSNEKKNNKNTILEALILTREKIEEETIQRMEKFNIRPRKKFNNHKACRFCNAPIWSPTHKCPALDQTCNKCGKKGHFARTCRQGENFENKLRNVTGTEKNSTTDTGSPISIMPADGVIMEETENQHYGTHPGKMDFSHAA